MRILAFALAMACFLPRAAVGQPAGENLQFRVPAGFKAGSDQRRGDTQLTELIPEGESLRTWTEMVSVQAIFGNPMTLDHLQANMQGRPAQGCRDSKLAILGKGQENGYGFLSWSLSCSFTEHTGKPEHSWFKAIRGNDALYVVHKAFRSTPSKEKVTQWMQHLQSVTLCDTRLPDRPCQGLKPVAKTEQQAEPKPAPGSPGTEKASAQRSTTRASGAGRPAAANEDARECLKLSSSTEIIKCTEKFR